MRNTSSCLECRRRKQKCVPSKDGRGSCTHCLRRYPPVECTGRPDRDDPTKARRAPNMQNIIHTRSEIESLRVTAPEEHSIQDIGLTIASSQGAFGGVLAALNASNGFSIKPTLRNAELFHLFQHHVVPDYTSIDGENVPPIFQAELLPLIFQSPIIPKIGIMMASAAQAIAQGHGSRNKETLAMKANVLSLMNMFLKQDFNIIASEALQAVTHLVLMEFFWGDEASLWSHMQGLKKMIKLQGGLANLELQVLALVLQMTDYELACFYERELLFTHQDFPGEEDFQLPNLTPNHLNGPLLVGTTTFSPTEDLSLSTKHILHDVQRLTSLVNLPSSIKNITEIQLEASLLYNKIKALPMSEMPLHTSEQERIFETVRLAALVYTCCISTLTPFSQQHKNPELQKLHTHVRSVTFSTWKKVPAVLLWILLVACSKGTRNDDWGKWLSKKMAVTGMAIGMEDFGVVLQCLKRFWTVQRWIAWCCRGSKGGVME